MKRKYPQFPPITMKIQKINLKIEGKTYRNQTSDEPQEVQCRKCAFFEKSECRIVPCIFMDGYYVETDDTNVHELVPQQYVSILKDIRPVFAKKAHDLQSILNSCIDQTGQNTLKTTLQECLDLIRDIDEALRFAGVEPETLKGKENE